MHRLFLTVLMLLVCLIFSQTSHAQLPPAAYEGDLSKRVFGGFKCVTQDAIIPQFIRKGEPAGVFFYAVPGSSVCVKGGAAAGWQF